MIGQDNLNPEIILQGLSSTDPALLTNEMNQTREVNNASALVPSEIAKNKAIANAENWQALIPPQGQLNLSQFTQGARDKTRGKGNSTGPNQNTGYQSDYPAGTITAPAPVAPVPALAPAPHPSVDPNTGDISTNTTTGTPIADNTNPQNPINNDNEYTETLSG